jgi:hypothetical protein
MGHCPAKFPERDLITNCGPSFELRCDVALDKGTNEFSDAQRAPLAAFFSRWVAAITGFGVRVMVTGLKVFVLEYRPGDRKR